MSRRFLMIAAGVFVFCTGVTVIAAYNFGADPFHPRSRHIWALSLVAAAYASIRIAMVVTRYLDARDPSDGASSSTGLPIFGKKDHAIDRRLAERRARVEAAKQSDPENKTINEETGDD